MPNLQSHQALFRQGSYTFDGWLAAPPETVIFSRAVNMPGGIPDQATSLTFDNAFGGVGTASDVEFGQEIIIRVGNTSAIRGRLWVAPGGSTATVLEVNEYSGGRVAVQDNDRIDVLNLFTLHDGLVAATATFDKFSRIPYSDQGTQHAPAVLVGCGLPGFVDATTSLLTVGFDASASYPTDRDNVGGLTYFWIVGAGTITVGANTDAAITATFPVGFHWVTLNVFDADTSEVTTRKIPVWAFDGTTYSPIPVKKATLTGSKQDGWGATFEMTTGCDVTSLPERSPVYYFEEEFYSGTQVSYGNQVADRSSVKFVGFLRRETISIDPDTDTLMFEAQSPLGKLGEIAGFSQDLKTATSPANWQEDEEVSIRTLSLYVWIWHTTASLLFDLVFDCTDYEFSDFAVQASNLLAQMREVCDGISASFTCDRAGRFIISRNLQRGTTTERNAALTTLALTTRDLLEIPSLVYEHSYQYNSLIGKFFTADPTTPVAMLSIAPGEAPAEAPEQTSFERGIAADQDEADWITNQIWAEKNGLYNGATVPVGATLKLRSAMDVVDPAYPEWLTLTLASTTNRRGRSFAADRFLLQRVEITCDPENGTKEIQWTVDHETLGQGAVTRDVDDAVDLPPYTPYPPAPIALPPPRLPAYDGVLPTAGFVLSASEGAAALITSLTPTGLTFDPWTTGITGTKFYDGCSNPYAYRQSFGLSDAGLEMCSDVPTKAAFSLTKSNAALFGSGKVGHRMRATIHRNGCLLAVSGTNALARTDNLFASVTQVSIDGQALNPSANIDDNTGADLCPVERTAGVWYALAPDVATPVYAALYKSTDYGASWSHWATTGLDYVSFKRMWIEIPYTRSGGVTANADNGSLEIWIYTAGDTHTGGQDGTWVSTDQGTTFAHGSYPGADVQNSAATNTHPNTSFTYDSAYGYWIDGGYVRGTSDHFATNTPNIVQVGNSGRCSVNGWSPNPLPFIGWTRENASNGVTVSTDGVTYGQGFPVGWSGGVAYAEFSLSTIQ